MKKIAIMLFLLLIGCFASIKAQTIFTVAGNGTAGSAGDNGAATAAELNVPIGVVVDAGGNIYISDYGTNTVRKVNTAGIITTVAGNGTAGFLGDGGPATAAEMQTIAGLAIDGTGNLYIADAGNNRIRKVSTAGMISTISGTGTAGSAGDSGPATAAQFNDPWAVAVDASGNVYVADVNNNRIRKINSAGIINTIAGNGTAGFAGDGSPATAAELNGAAGIAVSGGVVYIADAGNSRIRKINTSGIITTVAGNGTGGYAGDGAAATAAQIAAYTSDLAIDASGNLFIGDRNNNRVRVVNTSGTITTFAGNGSGSYSGDGGPATAAGLYHPRGICFGPGGKTYLVERGSSRVRVVRSATGIGWAKEGEPAFKVVPNPNNGVFNIRGTVNPTGNVSLPYFITDMLGRVVHSSCLAAHDGIIEQEVRLDGSVAAGIYILTIGSLPDGRDYRIMIDK